MEFFFFLLGKSGDSHNFLNVCYNFLFFADTSTGVVFIRPEEEGPKQPRKHWDQAPPIADVFGDKKFEEAVTRSISRDADDEDDDVLATGAPLLPVVTEPTVSGVCVYMCVCTCVCVRQCYCL